MMTARKILVIVSAICFVLAWFTAFTISLTDFGVWMALSMLCLIGNGCIRWVQDRREHRRVERERVWIRRDLEQMERAMREVRK